MPQFVPIENYADNTILTQAQLHALAQSIADFLNNTKIDEENIEPGSITSQSLAANAVASANIAPAAVGLPQLATDVVKDLVPAGAVMPYAGTVIPAGWFYCDGTAISRTINAALFGAIGVLHGTGDGSSTFNLPDYRGWFLRGQDDSAGVDPDASARTAVSIGAATGDSVGSVQADQPGPHNHVINISDPGHAHSYTVPQFVEETHNGGGGARFPSGATTSVNGTGISANSDSNGTTEDRPKNKYVKFIIKA